MSDIVKICKIHGLLDKNLTVITKRNRVSKKTGHKVIDKWIRCRKCLNQIKVNWCRKNREKVNANERRKRAKPGFVEKCRAGFIKRKYGITIEDYQNMLVKQNNVCAICFKEDMTIEANSMRLKGLCIDHCHVTNKVRGLLCNKCNPMIGYSKDSIKLLESAISYLKAHQD
jgi:hypothetical protein